MHARTDIWGWRRGCAVGLLAALAGLWLLPAPAGAYCGADCGGVQVNINGVDGPLFLSADLEANADAYGEIWNVRNGADMPATYADGGASVKELLELSHVDPKSLTDDPVVVDYVGGGAPDPLTKQEVIDGFGNPEHPEYPPVGAFFRPETLAADVLYDRSLRGRDEVGINIPRIAPAPFVIKARTTGAVLGVVAAADPLTAKATKPVTFSASARDGDDAGWSYTWDFGDLDDAQTSTGASVMHQFADPGTYKVRVTAETDHGDAGVSDPLRFRVTSADDPGNEPAPGGGGQGAGSVRVPVGSVRDPTAAPSGAGTASPQAAATGPDRSTATSNVAGKDTGTTSTRAGGSAGSGGKSTGASGRGSGGGSGSGSGNGSSDGQGSGGGHGAVSRQGSAKPAQGGAGGGADTRRPERSRGADRIEGVLLADGGAATEAQAASAARQAQARRQQLASRSGQGSSGGWPVWVGGALALTALLAVGGALELLPATRREVWPAGRRGLLRASSYRRVWV